MATRDSRLGRVATWSWLVLLTLGPGSATAAAQTEAQQPVADSAARHPAAVPEAATVRVVRATPVLMTPRGDGLVLGTVPAGAVLEVRAVQGSWLRVNPPEGATWKTGWVHVRDLETVTGTLVPPAERRASAPRPPGRRSIRGFVEGGGMLFAARDTFEAVLDTRFGGVYGGGGEVGFANGSFVQVGVNRFKRSGSRVIATPSQLFRIDVPHTVTITPVELTLGYRVTHSPRIKSAFGAGLGWYRLEETTPSLSGTDTDTGHFGYHVRGGIEVPLVPWVALAGDAQWAGVPRSIGDAGVSQVFDETDLGGATFRLKILVGR